MLLSSTPPNASALCLNPDAKAPFDPVLQALHPVLQALRPRPPRPSTPSSRSFDPVHHQTGPALPPQLHGRGIPPTASEHPPAFSPRPPLIYSTVGGSSRAGPANGALGYLALFLYGSPAVLASATVLFRYVRGAE